MSPEAEGWKRPIEYQDSDQIGMTPDWDAFFYPFRLLGRLQRNLSNSQQVENT